MEITEKIKSFEDACEHLGIEPKLPEVEGLFPAHQKGIVAFYKLSVIISALNEGWQPNWADYSERKWFNWFYIDTDSNSAGFVTSSSNRSPSHTLTYFGSRLCFKSQELAGYTAERFLDLYNDYLMLT